MGIIQITSKQYELRVIVMPHEDRDTKNLVQHTYGTWRRQELWKRLLLIKDAEGVYFFDDSGKRYLDMSSQL